MKNKIFKFIIGLAIFGMPLAACGSSSGNNQPSVDPTPTPTPTPIDPDPKTVTDRDAFLEAASKVNNPGYKSADVTYRNYFGDDHHVVCGGQFTYSSGSWKYYGDMPSGAVGQAVREATEKINVKADQVTYFENVWRYDGFVADSFPCSYYMDTTGFKFVTTIDMDWGGDQINGNFEAIFDSYGFLVKITKIVVLNGSANDAKDVAFHATYSTKELTSGPGPQPPEPGDKKEINEETFFEYADKYTSLESNYRSAYVKLEGTDSYDYLLNAELYLARDIDTGRWSFHHGDSAEASLALTYISLTASNVTESIIQFTETHFYIDTNGYLYFTGVQETNGWYVTYNLSFDRYGFVTVFDGRAVHDGDEEIILMTVTYSTEDLGPVPGPGPQPPEPEKYDTTKRAVPGGYSVFAQGGALGWDLGIEGTEMAPASIKDVSGLSTDVADALQAKFDKATKEEKQGFYLYTLEVKLEGEAGWTTNVMKDGEVYAVDGANTIRGRMGRYIAEEEAWISNAWFPDPHLYHAESLTPSTLFIAENWAGESDEHGFDWTSNPAAYEQGTYTFVLAIYSWVAPTATAVNVGMALIK